MGSARTLGIAVTALALSHGAQASQAFVTSGASMVAGPGADYPTVAELSPGEPVQVIGCLEGYGWCDIAFQGYRGWFDGRLLAAPLNGLREPLLGFGGEIGVPVVGFTIEDYWGRFYRGQPFYRDRARWAAGQGSAPGRVHGPVRGTADHGPHLPPTPTLQPRPRDQAADPTH
jgi:uncharacterized protein YraI